MNAGNVSIGHRQPAVVVQAFVWPREPFGHNFSAFDVFVLVQSTWAQRYCW